MDDTKGIGGRGIAKPGGKLKQLNIFSNDTPKPCLSPLNYLGGKFFIAKDIISLFPFDYQNMVYLEPFGGAAHVLMQKKASRLEVYNDINSEMVNLFRILQNKEKAEILIRLLYLTPYSRIWHEELRRNRYYPPGVPEDIQKAYRLLTLMKQSFSGNLFDSSRSIPSWARDITDRCFTTTSWNFAKFPAQLLKVVERIRLVQFENMDFREFIKVYSGGDKVMYCDPPYKGKEFYYEGNFQLEDHEELARLLNAAEGYILVSYYDFPDLESFYPPEKWHRVKINAIKHSQNKKNGQVRDRVEEIVLMNYDPMRR